MQKILVTTDFSPESLNAFRYAIQLADHTGASIDLLHVLLPDYMGLDTPIAVQTNTVSKNEVVKKRLLSFTSTALAQIDTSTKLKNVPDIHPIIRTGTPLFSILAIADQSKADLLVLGTRGNRKTPFEKLGSIAAKVVENTYCNTLVVPETASFSNISSILYASNYSKEDPFYLWKTMNLLEPITANVDIVHVNVKGKSAKAEIGENLRQYFAENPSGMQTKFHQINASNIETGLLKYADTKGIDLMVMYAPTYPLLKEIFHQKHTKRMTKLTNIPLLIIKGI